MARGTVTTITALVCAAVIASPAAAAPSCVAQSGAAERELYGTAWGKEVVSFVARNPGALGASNFGEIASLFARSDPAACPEEG